MYLNTLDVAKQCLTTALKKMLEENTSTLDLRGGNHEMFLVLLKRFRQEISA